MNQLVKWSTNQYFNWLQHSFISIARYYYIAIYVTFITNMLNSDELPQFCIFESTGGRSCDSVMGDRPLNCKTCGTQSLNQWAVAQSQRMCCTSTGARPAKCNTCACDLQGRSSSTGGRPIAVHVLYLHGRSPCEIQHMRLRLTWTFLHSTLLHCHIVTFLHGSIVT